MVYRCIKNNGKLGEISGKPYDCLVSPIFARDTRRIGGLENRGRIWNPLFSDTRRIGGLEIVAFAEKHQAPDTRRIGGLEIKYRSDWENEDDTRRIGGLETMA